VQAEKTEANMMQKHEEQVLTCGENKGSLQFRQIENTIPTKEYHNKSEIKNLYIKNARKNNRRRHATGKINADFFYITKRKIVKTIPCNKV
jgi:hypothetical protein